jgi:hypothetical protein
VVAEAITKMRLWAGSSLVAIRRRPRLLQWVIVGKKAGNSRRN